MCVTLTYGITGFLHLITLVLTIWLFQMFLKIVQLPPDMNPLEENMASRTRHKRNNSSIASESAWHVYDSKSARFSHSTHRQSIGGSVHQDFSRPPSIPFMHTLIGSSSTIGSHTTIPVGNSPRDSRMDLPSHTYGVPYAWQNNNSQADLKRQSIVRSQAMEGRRRGEAIPHFHNRVSSSG